MKCLKLVKFKRLGKTITSNSRKILNDPIYGFITIPFDIIYDLIEHPYFQRLRRINQLGLSHLVYPGGLHNRFHHAIGAMHLMQHAIEVIRSKGHEITDEEAEAVTIAILLHDIGHGPFSHALEHSIVEGIHHEDISVMLMDALNVEFNGQLDLSISIFKNEYRKKFLHQLVSSQLDMDRLDYLKRDSFYSGVSEGVIGSDRIIKMLNVANDELVIEEKGIYSIENFIVARRFMYWQVYLHKTVVSAEFMLVKILQRAKELANNGTTLFCSPALQQFLYNHYTKQDFDADPTILKVFSKLDDFDILGAIKVWANNDDKVLSLLCTKIIDRKLFKIELQRSPYAANYITDLKNKVQTTYALDAEEVDYFVIQNHITNNAYNPTYDRINILFKNGEIMDIAEASDNLNIAALSSPVKKYFVCYPKEIVRN